MSSIENSLKISSPGVLTANLACVMAMVTWAVAFPIAEVMLQSWGAIALAAARQLLGIIALLILWLLWEGWEKVISAPWWSGLRVDSFGFGLGVILLLVGQQMSDPITPAIAAAMMPIFGAVLEVVLDGRKMRWFLVVGIVLALFGGFLATGVRLSEGRFGLGVVLCLLAVLSFAWTTRSTTRSFPGLSALGQTTITLVGGLALILFFYAIAFVANMQMAQIGVLDPQHVTMLLVASFASLAFAQLLWIWGAGGLGILLASFHMNAVPFYVMVIVVLTLDGQWNWIQAIGAALVATGVIISQVVSR